MTQARTLADTIAWIEERGASPNIGQYDAKMCRALDREVKAGRLAKYRGYWDSLSPRWGIGPLKTIYATPAYAAAVLATA